MSHVGIDHEDLISNNNQNILKLQNLKILHLSQLNSYPLPSTSSLYIQTTTNEAIWKTVSSIFPNLEQMLVRVRSEAIPEITGYLKAHFKSLIEYKVYSAQSVLHEYFGRHQRYNCSKIEGQRKASDSYNGEGFFSESYFDRIKDL